MNGRKESGQEVGGEGVNKSVDENRSRGYVKEHEVMMGRTLERERDNRNRQSV